jgi:hypothetical protein
VNPATKTTSFPCLRGWQSRLHKLSLAKSLEVNSL